MKCRMSSKHHSQCPIHNYITICIECQELDKEKHTILRTILSLNNPRIRENEHKSNTIRTSVLN